LPAADGIFPFLYLQHDAMIKHLRNIDPHAALELRPQSNQKASVPVTSKLKTERIVLGVTGSKAQLAAAEQSVRRIWQLLELAFDGEQYAERRFQQALKRISFDMLSQGVVSDDFRSTWKECMQSVSEQLQTKAREVTAKLRTDLLENANRLLLEAFEGSATWRNSMWQITEQLMKQKPNPVREGEKERRRRRRRRRSKNAEINSSPHFQVFGNLTSVCAESLRKLVQQRTDKAVEKIKADPEHLPTPSQWTDLHKALKDQVERIVAVLEKGPTTVDWRRFSQLCMRATVVVNAFALNLPIFRRSTEVLELVRKNRLISVSTGTGSGKSTVLPALLYAAGFNKIVVTQPRRLPCRSIAHRVGSTCGK
jgi:hypothetical protein